MPQQASQIKQIGTAFIPSFLALDYILWNDTYRTLVLVLALNFTFLLAVAFKMSFMSIICDFLFVYIFLGICINYLSDSLGYPLSPHR